MTKKHFIEIANLLNYLKHSMPSNTHGLLVEGMEEICKGSNVNFDSEKFLNASGYYNNERTSE
jgi:hypothetical protein